MTHRDVTPIIISAHSTNTTSGWLGTFPTGVSIANYIDTGLMLIFGGIPWQVRSMLCHDYNAVNLVHRTVMIY